VLEFSSAVEHRRVASDAVGYARQSQDQILALVRAARDPDDEVRNNATRALGVLARSNAALASEIPADTFIDMLNSGVWTDRAVGPIAALAYKNPKSPGRDQLRPLLWTGGANTAAMFDRTYPLESEAFLSAIVTS